MNEREIYSVAVWCWIALAAVVLPALLVKPAPYGRHMPATARFTVPSRIGWIVMEAPSAIVFAACALAAPESLGTVPLVLMALWQIHYLNRTLVYPFRMRGGDRPMPIAICVSAFCFT